VDAPPLFRDAPVSSLESSLRPPNWAAAAGPLDQDLSLDQESVDDDDRPGGSPLDVPLRRSDAGRPLDKLASIENSDVWREELSERVETFRRRRARLRDFDPKRSLDFEFGPGSGGGSGARESGNVDELPKAGEEQEVAGETGGENDAELDDRQDAVESGGSTFLGSTAGEAVRQDRALGPSEPPAGSSRSLDLILGDEPWSTQAAPEPEVVFHPAPLAPRFLAALIDALVLLVGGGIFALIFWAAGGRVDRSPVTLAVAGFIAVLLILVYFGSFTALTFSTPGLLSMGLEVRTLDGAPPTLTDAALRAFGVVVSASALMLGFIWALVDSDALTWHDRMSGTFITAREPASRPGD